jgi:SurA N-terminal domain
MSRTAVTLAAVAAAAGLAVSACSTNQMGAAAITGNSRISSSTLTAQVTNLNAAYSADQAKGIKPQRPAGQETQQVLSWLILFRIYDKVAAQHGISVTPAQSQQQIATLTAQAAQNKLTLEQYVSAAGALPPDLIPQLGQYFAIESVLTRQIDGGKAPTTAAGQSKLESQVGHDQCLAAKSLAVNVNPQYGQFDFATYSVAIVPPTLAADPTPSPAPSPLQTTAPC